MADISRFEPDFHVPDSVVAELKRELKEIGPGVPGTLAATAMRLASKMDDDDNSATSVSMCAKSMIDVLRELREYAPAKRSDDSVDDLDRARQKRRQRFG